MPTCKRIVCLANSRKLQGRCIAGRELVVGEPGGWIRPVSAREHEEVSEYERQYEDGSDPRVLDVIDVPLRQALPKGYQQENWLLNPEIYWVKVGRFRWADLAGLTESSGSLWINGNHTYNGVNDKIPMERTTALQSSLKLVYVDELSLKVFRPGEAFGNPKRRVQGSFRFAGDTYKLWITDPGIEKAYLAGEDGTYRIGDSYLTVSLGEPFNDCCHKLIAAVIQPV